MTRFRTPAGTLWAPIVRDITEQDRAERLQREPQADPHRRKNEHDCRELHDDIGQRVALLAGELTRLPDTPARFREADDQTTKQAVEIATIFKPCRTSYTLETRFAGHGGCDEKLYDEFADQQHVVVDFATREVPGQLPSDISLCFRVLQRRSTPANTAGPGVRRATLGRTGQIHLCQ